MESDGETEIGHIDHLSPAEKEKTRGTMGIISTVKDQTQSPQERTN